MFASLVVSRQLQNSILVTAVHISERHLNPLLFLLVMFTYWWTLIEHEQFLRILVQVKFENLFFVKCFILIGLLHYFKSLEMRIFHTWFIVSTFGDDWKFINHLLNFNRTEGLLTFYVDLLRPNRRLIRTVKCWQFSSLHFIDLLTAH